MGINWELLDKQGIKRSGNAAKGDPRKFVIVGIDISVDDLIAKFDGDARAQEIIHYGARDEARLRVPLPPGFVEGFEDSSPVAIYFTQLIDKSGRSWPLVTDGRSRCLAMRYWADKHAAAKVPVRSIDAEIDTFTGKTVGVKALRNKLFRNRHIPDGIGVLAERAADFKRLGYSPEDTAREMAASPEDVKKYLKWHGVWDNLCVEAQTRATAGNLRLGAAIRLTKFSKSEQKERLEGKRAPQKASGRPLSPRTLGIFREQIDAIASQGPGGKVVNKSTGPAHPVEALEQLRLDSFLLGLRLASGDKSATKELPDGLRAAWLRTVEQAAKKPRRAE